MKTKKKQSSPKAGNKVTATSKPKTYQQARVDAVKKEVVNKGVRKLEEVIVPKARELTDGEKKFLVAGTYRADYIRQHLQLGWDATKQEPRKQKAGEGWESIIRLGAEQKSLGENSYNSYKTQCQQALEEFKINYSLQGAGAKQLVDLKPKRVSKGGNKGKDNTKAKDKPSQNAVSTWVANILAGLKDHEVEELVFDLADSLAPVSQQALLSHLLREHNDWFMAEVKKIKKSA
jgi:hypothetical protein